MSSLRYLDFDLSDDGSGRVCFEAMAAVRPDQLAALHAELTAVLAWAQARFPDGPGPLDEGASWDLDLQASVERSRAEPLRWEAGAGRLVHEPAAGAETVRHGLSVALAAGADFAAAFVAHFGLDAD